MGSLKSCQPAQKEGHSLTAHSRYRVPYLALGELSPAAYPGPAQPILLATGS